MHPIDWWLVIIPLGAFLVIGWWARRFMQSVADFLAGGRVAGRYLLTVAEGMGSIGLISVVASMEQTYKSGSAIGYWGSIAIPVSLIMTLQGFVIYRYRETRALTLAQFFEMRYSRGIRILAGTICWISGVVNYALFPAVGARFMIYYCQLPTTIEVFGVPIGMYGLLMALFLGLALVIVFLGGQITTMVTDCVQGIFGYVAYAVIVIAILVLFSFDHFREAFLARPPGESFINPFDTAKLTDFNILFVLITIVNMVYCRMAWQGTQGFNCAAKSPHEQKMAGVLSAWRAGYSYLMIGLLALAAYTYMNHPDFASGAAAVQQELQQIQADNPTTTQTLQTQLRVPVAIRHFLPVGVSGLFVALMIFLMVSTDTAYLHSWGSIFIQDVILPWRRKPFTPTRQVQLLRASILGVAVFAWLFSFFYSQTTYIFMFQWLTGSLFLGFAGSLIIGGLYWRRGTTAAAYAAIIVGVSWALFAFYLTQCWASHVYPWLSANAPGVLTGLTHGLDAISARLAIASWKVTPERCPISGMELHALNIVWCITTYVVVSFLTCRQPFNLERMLHRGIYARAEDRVEGDLETPRRWWQKLVGIDREYTRGDRILAWSVFIWTMIGFAYFVVTALWNIFISRWSDETWFALWKYWGIGTSVLIGAITTVWFTWGSTRDLVRFFRALREVKRSALDDGRVVGHVSADDVALVEKVEHTVIPEAHRDPEAKP